MSEENTDTVFLDRLDQWLLQGEALVQTVDGLASEYAKMRVRLQIYRKMRDKKMKMAVEADVAYKRREYETALKMLLGMTNRTQPNEAVRLIQDIRRMYDNMTTVRTMWLNVLYTRALVERLEAVGAAAEAVLELGNAPENLEEYAHDMERAFSESVRMMQSVVTEPMLEAVLI